MKHIILEWIDNHFAHLAKCQEVVFQAKAKTLI
jgi:hypothetical protein